MASRRDNNSQRREHPDMGDALDKLPGVIMQQFNAEKKASRAPRTRKSQPAHRWWMLVASVGVIATMVFVLWLYQIQTVFYDLQLESNDVEQENPLLTAREQFSSVIEQIKQEDAPDAEAALRGALESVSERDTVKTALQQALGTMASSTSSTATTSQNISEITTTTTSTQ